MSLKNRRGINLKRKMIKSIVLICVALLFASCGKAKNTTQNSNIEEKKLSPLASDPAFKNSIHKIRNDATNTYSIVKGD